MNGMEVMVLTVGFGAIGWLLRARILTKLFQFDCPHKTVTMPMRRADGVDRASCLDCGKLLDYQALTKCEWLNQ